MAATFVLEVSREMFHPYHNLARPTPGGSTPREERYPGALFPPREFSLLAVCSLALVLVIDRSRQISEINFDKN